MARYFFDLHDGEDIPDQEGSEFPTLEDARHHAVIVIARLLMKDPGKFWAGDAWTLEVKDDLGVVLFSVVFSATQSLVAGPALPMSAAG